ARSAVPKSKIRWLPRLRILTPSYKSNELGFTSCNPGGGVLAPRSTAAVMVRTEPSDDAPFLEDPALAAVGAEDVVDV
ncbi:hypothetical protein, partial [Brachybacterium muris]